jgi:hypothetical protein
MFLPIQLDTLKETSSTSPITKLKEFLAKQHVEDVTKDLSDQNKLKNWIDTLTQMIQSMKHQENLNIAQELKISLEDLFRTNNQDVIPKVNKLAINCYKYFLIKSMEYIQLAADLESLSKTIDSSSDSANEFVEKTFLERTQSMIRALSTIADWIHKKGFEGPVFLIAGQTHLKTPEEFQNKPSYSLTTFYKTLDKLPAVVLVPRHG